MNRHISGKQLTAFERHLRLEERESGTIEKYLRDIRAFAAWLEDKPLDKEAAVAWKEHLLASGYAPSTINSMLIAVNRFSVSNTGMSCVSRPCAFSAGSSAAGRGN